MRLRPGHNVRDLLRSRLSSRLNYKYEPLPSPNAIRLLQIHPSGPSGNIHCSLKIFEQGHVPPYHALSYTWGYPLTPFSKVSKSSSFVRLNLLRKLANSAPNLFVQDGKSVISPRGVRYDSRYFPITCADRTMLVTANLHDALNMLRGLGVGQFVETSQETPPKDGTTTRADEPQYFWIDALCVDQSNIVERNAQVAMMASTFRAAQGVVVWLGSEDQFTDDALDLVNAVAALPQSVSAKTRYVDFFDPRWQDSAGGLTYRHWLAFLALINRPWFRRAWVVQELALARDAILICGKKRVSWSKLSMVLEFVRSKKWYHHLSTEKLSHLDAMAKNAPKEYKKFLASGTKLNIGSINLARTRRWVSTKKLGKLWKGSLERFMQMHRDTEATDPRDKVYAFIGLADDIASTKGPAQNEQEAKAEAKAVSIIRPDYQLPVHEVYTDVTARLMAKQGDLRMLFHVQDASRTKIKGLPSWVPDYSVELQPYPLSFRAKVNWNASGTLPWRQDVEAMKQGRLRVQGILLGSIQKAAMMPDEAGGSAQYWADVIDVAAALSPYHQAYAGQGAWSANLKPQTRVEVFWRTLITDTYSRQHPAYPSVGRLVLDYVLNLQIRQTLAPLSNLDFMPHQSPTTLLRGKGKPSAWQSLLDAEPPGSPYGPDQYRERISSVVESMLKEEYSPIGLAQLQHEFDYASGSMRRVFRLLRTGLKQPLLLGTGPRSLSEGDEVWVLAGAAVPMVLRPLAKAGGKAGRTHALVGEAYVHGAMHWAEVTAGRDVKEVERQLENITLV